VNPSPPGCGAPSETPHPEPYESLAESIIAWPNQQELAQKFKEAGFTSVQYRNLTGGIVAIHRGFKPEAHSA